MNRPLQAITAEIESLQDSDFDESRPDARGMERLWELCDELGASHAAGEAAPLLLALVERLANAHLGSPGPVVHTLEAMPGYEPFLVESVLRKPTELSVWMVNRIANAGGIDRGSWVQLLRAAAVHPGASEQARAEAREFAERHRDA